MKKSDLKSGDIVKTKEGAKYIVLLQTRDGDLLIDLDNGYYLTLSGYNEDLTRENLKQHDVIAICAEEYAGDNLRQHGLTSITAGFEWTWKRKDKKEMTIAEIEKELGYSIKIVKEK